MAAFRMVWRGIAYVEVGYWGVSCNCQDMRSQDCELVALWVLWLRIIAISFYVAFKQHPNFLETGVVNLSSWVILMSFGLIDLMVTLFVVYYYGSYSAPLGPTISVPIVTRFISKYSSKFCKNQFNLLSFIHLSKMHI